METLMTGAELAARLGVSVETVRWWRKQGTGPRAIKVGRRVFYSERDVRLWTDKHREPVSA